jgi:hypothetical protein
MVGSKEVAEIFADREVDILTYYNIDMLLVEDIHAPVNERVLLAHSGTAMNYATLTKTMSLNYGKNLIRTMEGGDLSVWGRSDHVSFLSEGYKDVLFAFESGAARDTAYHSPSDVWDNPLYNYTVAIDLVAAIGASMAYTLARAHDEPLTSEFQGRLREGAPQIYYFPITADTEIEIQGTWNGGTISLELQDQTGSTVDVFDSELSDSSFGSVVNFSYPGSGIYSIVISSEVASDIRFNLDIMYETDLNMDGIYDSDQFWLDAALFNLDDDLDNLSNGLETIIGTSPTSNDSDSDTLPDYWEYIYGTIPTVDDAEADPDRDLLCNLDEYTVGTFPLIADSDMDSLNDGWEYHNGTDALVPDQDADPDFDGLTNYQEYRHGTLPLSSDTDSDSMPDNFEVLYDLDPTVDDSMLDEDQDGLENLQEFIHGTSPRDSDSDNDLMPDGYEIENGFDPLVDDAGNDTDQDGKSNLDEYLSGTNPHVNESLNQTITLVAILGIMVVIVVIVSKKVLAK